MGCGNWQRSMDVLSNPNYMHECIVVTRTAFPTVETDLQTDGMLNLLLLLRGRVDLPKLTANLRRLRLARRHLRELTFKKKKLEKQLGELERSKTTAVTSSPVQTLSVRYAATARSDAARQHAAESESGLDRVADAAVCMEQNTTRVPLDLCNSLVAFADLGCCVRASALISQK